MVGINRSQSQMDKLLLQK